MDGFGDSIKGKNYINLNQFGLELVLLFLNSEIIWNAAFFTIEEIFQNIWNWTKSKAFIWHRKCDSLNIFCILFRCNGYIFVLWAKQNVFWSWECFLWCSLFDIEHLHFVIERNQTDKNFQFYRELRSNH